ncbi:hypothetical protein C0J26_05010 [Pseudomonas baetica]|uniref:transposase n=1 Tax=Pseudomonas baetica TaxID=674054 RepID=UPI000D1DA4BB|nr:transposase [Pseudomonas baetica]PTC20859.1 hypothetical protein C0J26_05010 [Pseudomonas baetica]
MRNSSDFLSRCPCSHFFDALRVKIRQEGLVRNRGDLVMALVFAPDGTRDILWYLDRKHRGAEVLDEGLQRPQDPRREDVLIAMTDSLKGMPEALSAVFSSNNAANAIVRPIPNSLDYAAWDKRRRLAKALKPIYQAINAVRLEHWMPPPKMAIGVPNTQRWWRPG